MAKGFIHTVHRDGQWINEVEGGAEIEGVHTTKAEAVSTGRARAQHGMTEHVIHEEGHNSYRNDSGSRPG